jgi:hypothetical protein
MLLHILSERENQVLFQPSIFQRDLHKRKSRIASKTHISPPDDDNWGRSRTELLGGGIITKSHANAAFVSGSRRHALLHGRKATRQHGSTTARPHSAQQHSRSAAAQLHGLCTACGSQRDSRAAHANGCARGGCAA